MSFSALCWNLKPDGVSYHRPLPPSDLPTILVCPSHIIFSSCSVGMHALLCLCNQCCFCTICICLPSIPCLPTAHAIFISKYPQHMTYLLVNMAAQRSSVRFPARSMQPFLQSREPRFAVSERAAVNPVCRSRTCKANRGRTGRDRP